VNQKGFSLLEIVIVLILIGLSISLVSPSLSRISKTIELKATAKKISSILRYYRSEAVQKGKVHQVLFDNELREVRIQAIESEVEQAGDGNAKPSLSAKKYPIPEGIQMKELKIPSPLYPAEVPAIEFYPTGGSNGGSILLDTPDHKGYRIKVHFITGIVAIEGI
jgi:general secretion pathway protein H